MRQSDLVERVAGVASRLRGELTQPAMGQWRFPEHEDAMKFAQEAADQGLGAWVVGRAGGLEAIEAPRGTLVRSLVDVEGFRAPPGRSFGPVRVGEVLRVTQPYDHNGYLDAMLVDGSGRLASLHASEIDVLPEAEAVAILRQVEDEAEEEISERDAKARLLRILGAEPGSCRLCGSKQGQACLTSTGRMYFSGWRHGYDVPFADPPRPAGSKP